LAFPVPSSTLPVARRALEVFRSLRDARFYPGVVPSRLWFPSRAPLSCGPALTGLLSWDSSGRTLTRSSPCTAPSSTWPRRVHSHPMSPSGFGSELPARVPVPSSWFLTTSTVSSASKRAGLLHPATDPGVHRVSCVRSPPASRSCRGRATRSPRCVHPSKNSRDRSCSASPRPLPPRRSAPFGAVDLEVLFHDRVCDVASALQMTRILSFLGFLSSSRSSVRRVFPIRVHPEMGRSRGEIPPLVHRRAGANLACRCFRSLCGGRVRERSSELWGPWSDRVPS
jgi:hypothetical protein